MKLTAKILGVILLLFTSGLFASNMMLKKEYDKIDKTDIYWTYGKILEQPFRHINIEGGNITQVVYQQSSKPSVRVVKDWYGYEAGLVKAYIKNDTLYLNIPNTYRNLNEKDYLRWTTVLRVFSPELLSVTGHDTRFEMVKMKQKDLSVNMSGKSYFELESLEPRFNNLAVVQKDSSEIQFEMDPALRTAGIFHVKNLKADLEGVSFLDIGHAQIDSVQINVSDSSGILLSGAAMKNKR